MHASSILAAARASPTRGPALLSWLSAVAAVAPASWQGPAGRTGTRVVSMSPAMVAHSCRDRCCSACAVQGRAGGERCQRCRHCRPTAVYHYPVYAPPAKFPSTHEVPGQLVPTAAEGRAGAKGPWGGCCCQAGCGGATGPCHPRSSGAWRWMPGAGTAGSCWCPRARRCAASRAHRGVEHCVTLAWVSLAAHAAPWALRGPRDMRGAG